MEIFSWFDLIALALIIILGIKGIMNGFIKEVFGLIGIIGGIFLATRYAEEFGVFISENIISIQNSSSIYLVGFVAILFLFWIACLFIGFIISKIVSFSALTFVNRILGFIVGSLKVFLVFSVLIAALSYIGFVKENFLDKYLKNSFMYESFLKTGKFIINLDYSSVDNTIEDFSSKIKEKTQDTTENTTLENNTLSNITQPISEYIENATDTILNNFVENSTLDINSTIEIEDNASIDNTTNNEIDETITFDNQTLEENETRSDTNG